LCDYLTIPLTKSNKKDEYVERFSKYIGVSEHKKQELLSEEEEKDDNEMKITGNYENGGNVGVMIF